MLDYKNYYSLVNECSERTRSVLYVMLITSILMFVPYWNVRSDNWLNSRIEVRQNIIKWYGWNPSILSKLKDKNDIENFNKSKNAAKLFGFDLQNTKRDSVNIITRFQNEITELRKINLAKSFISIPIFNVTVDINDLSLFGGFAFIIILSMLRASIWRELLNITYIFEEAENQNELLNIYRLLSMSQVLTSPPIKNFSKSKWLLLNLVYLFLPLFVQSYTFAYDFKDMQYALIQNSSATVFHLLFNLFSIIIIVILTLSSLKLSIEYNNKWDEAARKLDLNIY